MNYNNIKDNSINNNAVEIKRSGKKRAAVVARNIVASMVVVGILGSVVYFSNKPKTSYSEPNYQESIQETLPEKDTEVKQEELTDEEKLNKMFDDMYLFASENTIDNLTEYYEDHYFDLYGEEVNSDILYLYSANAYKKAQDAGVKREDLVKELDFMYQMQEIPSCFPETLIDNVKNLNGTIDERNESLFMIYGPLSVVAHNETCEKEHVINAAGGISHKGEEPDFEVYYDVPEKVMVLSK